MSGRINGSSPKKTNSVLSTHNGHSSGIKTDVINCPEHLSRELNLRCLTHKSWICSECVLRDHHTEQCQVITFEQEIENRKEVHRSSISNERVECDAAVAQLTMRMSELQVQQNHINNQLKDLELVRRSHLEAIDRVATARVSIEAKLEEGCVNQQDLQKIEQLINSGTTLQHGNTIRGDVKEAAMRARNWIVRSKENGDTGIIDNFRKEFLATEVCLLMRNHCLDTSGVDNHNEEVGQSDVSKGVIEDARQMTKIKIDMLLKVLTNLTLNLLETGNIDEAQDLIVPELNHVLGPLEMQVDLRSQQDQLSSENPDGQHNEGSNISDTYFKDTQDHEAPHDLIIKEKAQEKNYQRKDLHLGSVYESEHVQNISPWSEQVDLRPQQFEHYGQQYEQKHDQGRGGHHHQWPNDHQLFVGNIHHETTDEEIWDLFSTFGQVVGLHINPIRESAGWQQRTNKKLKIPPRCGFIIFKIPTQVQNVLENRPIYTSEGNRLNVEKKKSFEDTGHRLSPGKQIKGKRNN